MNGDDAGEEAPGQLSASELGELSLFAGLPDDKLEKIRAISHLHALTDGELMLQEGESAADVRIVISGKFNVCLQPPGRSEFCLSTLARGEMIGWSALMDDARWVASATAVKDSSVLVIQGKALRRLCEQDHEIGYRVMRNAFHSVASRLHDTRLQLVDMYGHD